MQGTRAKHPHLRIVTVPQLQDNYGYLCVRCWTRAGQCNCSNQLSNKAGAPAA